MKKIQTLSRLASIAALCAAAAVMAGCATASKPENMIAKPAVAGIHHPQTTSVVVAGGSETDSMGKSQISNDAFRQAIAASIEQSKTFSAVVQGKGGDYQLGVTVISMDQPSFGLSFTVKMEAAWSLKKADGTAVWQDSIKSEGTATTGDAFAGVERLRIANEKAAQANIATALGKIGQLQF